MRAPVDWPTRDLLTHRVAATPDRTVLVDADDGRTWTYRDLDAAVDGTAAELAALGATSGSQVGLLVDTRVAVVRTVHAAMRLNATLVLLNPELAPGELHDQVDRADLDLLVCERDTETLAVEVADCPVASVDEPGQAPVESLDAEAEGAESADPPAVPVQRGRDDVQVIVFTSGTTGAPKGVRLTAGNLVASATASAFRLGVQRGDRWLVCLPTYHMGGLAPLIRSTLYGTAVVLQRSFDADETRRVLADYDVTGVSLVPTMLKRLLDAGWDPSSDLRFVLVGGAPTPPELVQRCERQGVPVHPTYGLTEAASQVATATPDQAFDHPDTVGQPLVTTDVTVVDGDEVCDPGEVGELVVDGPTITPGYLDEGATREAFADRGLHTGDLGYRDEDGRLWVLGRMDDAVVTGGETVHPETVVDALREHPAVSDAAVVGLDDPEWGQRVAALVVPEGAVDTGDLAAHCRERLAPYEVPKTWAVADALPRTPSGTVDREAVRERLDGEWGSDGN
ncbi:o-succinylbenzoate--CoA ligase [Halobacteriales archaeon QS_1_68_20]|nr:MAG: o-succinylbenzoate--CoA ligase [Halobacteriales archaeon QS_1_68_20]